MLPSGRDSGNNFGLFSVSFFEGRISYIRAACNYPTRNVNFKSWISDIWLQSVSYNRVTYQGNVQKQYEVLLKDGDSLAQGGIEKISQAALFINMVMKIVSARPFSLVCSAAALTLPLIWVDKVLRNPQKEVFKSKASKSKKWLEKKAKLQLLLSLPQLDSNPKPFDL